MCDHACVTSYNYSVRINKMWKIIKINLERRENLSLMCSCPAFESDEYLCSFLFVQLGPSTTKRAEDFFVFVLNIRTHLLLLSIGVSILLPCKCAIRVRYWFCLGPGFIALDGPKAFSFLMPSSICSFFFQNRSGCPTLGCLLYLESYKEMQIIVNRLGARTKLNTQVFDLTLSRLRDYDTHELVFSIFHVSWVQVLD